MRRATQVISETKTDCGYVIRREIWPDVYFEDAPLGNVDDETQALVNAISGFAPPTEMETCYTYDGYWIGDKEVADMLCRKKGIAPEPRDPETKPGDLRPCSIGFNAKEQKWYGWSHRAIFGFGIGSEVKPGDCAYTPVDMEDARRDAIRFWSEDAHVNVDAVLTEDEDGVPCFEVTWTNVDDAELIPNEKVRGKIRGCRHYPPKKFGRGAWIAKTLEDAKQMASDFAEGVS